MGLDRGPGISRSTVMGDLTMSKHSGHQIDHTITQIIMRLDSYLWISQPQ